MYGTTSVITLPDGTVTLDDLVARVEAGEEIMITRDGKLVARLVPGPYVPHPSKPVRRPGLYAGMGSIGPEFFEPLPEEELRLWEDGEDERAPPESLYDGDRAGAFPAAHRDPFDRMLAAQALNRGLALVSNDAALDAFGVRRIW